ncbi:MAG: hypothetical protein AAFX06_21825, partial [Planctomycetota bacterium]
MRGMNVGRTAQWRFRPSPIRESLRDGTHDFAIANGGVFSPDERLLVLQAWDVVTIWDWKSKTKVGIVELPDVSGASFIDNRHIVLCNETGLYRCDLDELSVTPARRVEFANGNMMRNAIAIPLQTPGVFLHRRDGAANLIHFKSDAHTIEKLADAKRITHLEQSLEGRFRCMVNDQNVARLTDLSTGELLFEHTLDDEHITTRFSRDSQQVAILSADKCHVFDTAVPGEVRTIALDSFPQHPQSLEFNAAGTELAIADSHGNIHLLDVASGSKLYRLPARFSSSWMCFANGDRILATCDSIYRFNAWNLGRADHEMDALGIGVKR